jgi:hypothetical protein
VGSRAKAEREKEREGERCHPDKIRGESGTESKTYREDQGWAEREKR